jgi:hypothetical protein
MNEMVERVARTIFEHWFLDDWPPTHAVDLGMDADDFRAAAKEVIRAMREPTDEMVDEAWNNGRNDFQIAPREAYQRMIGAALEE